MLISSSTKTSILVGSGDYYLPEKLNFDCLLYVFYIFHKIFYIFPKIMNKFNKICKRFLLRFQIKQKCTKLKVCKSIGGVMVIVVGNGHGDSSSNPGRE